MRGAVFFDVDGTLVYKTSSSQHLAGFLGHADALGQLEEAYASGTAHNSEVALHDARAYAGHSEAHLRPWLQQLPLIAGIQEVVDRCRELDLAPYLATLAWQPVGRYLCDSFGFDGACGPCLAETDGAYTGDVAMHFTEYDKRDFAMSTADELGLDPAACIAIGDSRSDVPLFAEVGLAIAFNATPSLRAVASAAVDGPDLRAVLPIIEDWLNAH